MAKSGHLESHLHHRSWQDTLSAWHKYSHFSIEKLPGEVSQCVSAGGRECAYCSLTVSSESISCRDPVEHSPWKTAKTVRWMCFCSKDSVVRSIAHGYHFNGHTSKSQVPNWFLKTRAIAFHKQVNHLTSVTFSLQGSVNYRPHIKSQSIVNGNLTRW